MLNHKDNRMFRSLLVIIFCIFAGSVSAQECPAGMICTDSTTRSSVDSNSRTTVISPPSTAIAPSINSSTTDSCTVGVSGAVQTQILGLSAGKTVRDINCERLKNAKTLYDMGMKVAAVSTMCQDPGVFDAMMNAGTPCPYDGMIGQDAKNAWKLEKAEKPKGKGLQGTWKNLDEDDKGTAKATIGIGGLLFLLLLL
jgi:hypothetical protein